MRRIDQILVRFEREVAIIFTILLIAFNLTNLYFIIDFLSYDEIVGYLDDGGLKCSDPHDIIYVLLITAALNLLFVFTSLWTWFTRSQ